MFNKKELDKFYRYCYSLTLNEATAYDLLQNALEKLLKNTSEKKNTTAFMYTIIRHQFIDDFRVQKKYDTKYFEENNYIDVDIKTLENLIIDEDLVEQILHYLKPLEREIIFYWVIEGYSTQQVAKILKMPKGTVLSKIHRLRQRIKQHFSVEKSILFALTDAN